MGARTIIDAAPLRVEERRRLRAIPAGSDAPPPGVDERGADGATVPSPLQLDFRMVLDLLADAGYAGAKFDEWLVNFSEANRDRAGKLELTAAGVLLAAPMQSKAGSQWEATVLGELYSWARRHGGEAHGARLGIRFPNGACYAPDAAWLSPDQLNAYAPATDTWLLHFCPYFVVEIRSRHERLAAVRRKLEDYIANGAALGWLIDPIQRRVYIYRPGRAPETLEDPAEVSGEPELPDFRLAVRALIFDAP